MKITEFVLLETKGKNALDWEYLAEVSVRRGFFGKWTREKVSRKYAGAWSFVEDGKFTPGFVVEELERAYRARESFGLAK